MAEPDDSDSADESNINDWIESALKMVNGLRHFHAAPPLEWSQECFEAAQRQAFECEEQQGLFSGNTGGASGTHGQNLYYSERPIDNEYEIENVIDAWYEFSEMYCFIDPGPSTGSEFLTQLLWASTEQFGLAVSDDGCYVVANFYPAGNIQYRYDTNVHLPEYVCPEDVTSTGILFGSFPPSNLIVRKVFDDSWAKSEEIKEGDRFVAINGHMVPAMTKEDFSELIKERPLRLRLHVGIDQTFDRRASLASSGVEEELMNQVHERSGSIGRGKIELVARDDVIKLGMVMSMPPRPLEVRKVVPGGWADQKGIEPGDTFTQINGRPVWEISNEELVQILTTHIRPLVFRLATTEEHATATKIQKNFRGKLDREVTGAMMRLSAGDGKASSKDWRMARNRKAKLEKYEDENKDQELVEMQMPREDLVSRVYLALDEDKDKQLNETEMFSFARGLAFPNDKEAWAKEYADICADSRLDEGQNISFEDFKDLVNEEGPYYCGYDRLNAILVEDEKKEVAIRMQASFRGVMARKKTAELRKTANQQASNESAAAATKIQAKFRGKQGRRMAAGKLEQKDQERVATKIQAVQRGKKGRQMAQQKCEEKQARQEAKEESEQDQKKAEDVPKESAKPNAKEDTAKDSSAADSEKFAEKDKALDASADSKQVEDSKPVRKIPKSYQKGNGNVKAGETTTTADLPPAAQGSQSSASKDVRKDVSQPQGASVKKNEPRPKGAPRKVPEDIFRKDVDARSQVFLRYDADEDGRLNEEEMLAFARCLGYDGSRQAWCQEFRALCEEHGWDAAVGLNADAFKWLTTNTEDQYWFDADKLRDGGWEAAAGHPVQPERSKQKGFEPLSRVEGVRELEVPLQAEIAGLDWDQLEMDETLKADVIRRIQAAVAEKAGVNMDDLRVSLAPGAS